MQIRINKAFIEGTVEFTPGILTLPDELAEQIIADGRAEQVIDEEPVGAIDIKGFAPPASRVKKQKGNRR